MMSRGFLPYRDFPLPHLPALELAVAALFSVVPATLKTAEIVTQCAAYAGSWLVFLIGRRLGDVFAGAAAAVIFATSALLFRYHLFEREVFVVVPVMAAVLMVSAPALRHPWSGRATLVAVSAGALLALALAIKLSAAAALVGVGLHLLTQRRRQCATVVVGTALGLAGLAAIVLFVAFRADFIVQVFLFRAVHATFPSLLVKFDEMRLTTDIAFAPSGEMFMTDGYGNARVHKFSADAKYLSSWGEPGNAPGQFNLPHGIWIDRRGRVLVADRENDRVQVFDQEGKLLTVWPTELIGPAFFYVDDDDVVYIPEHNGGRISILTLDGERLARWGDGPVHRSCHGIWVDSHRDLYVVQPGEWGRARRVVKYVRQ